MATKSCPETDCTESLTTRTFEFDPEPSTDRPTPEELRRQYESGKRECPEDEQSDDGPWPAYLDDEDAPALIDRATAEVEHHCSVHGVVGRE